MILGELNRVLNDWWELEEVEDNGDGNRIRLATKSRVDYFNEHLADTVSFITQDNSKIIIFMSRY